jgi:hypothetical protein
MRNIILHLNLLVDAAAQQAHEHEKGVFIHLLAVCLSNFFMSLENRTVLRSRRRRRRRKGEQRFTFGNRFSADTDLSST